MRGLTRIKKVRQSTRILSLEHFSECPWNEVNLTAPLRVEIHLQTIGGLWKHSAVTFAPFALDGLKFTKTSCWVEAHSQILKRPEGVGAELFLMVFGVWKWLSAVRAGASALPWCKRSCPNHSVGPRVRLPALSWTLPAVRLGGRDKPPPVLISWKKHWIGHEWPFPTTALSAWRRAAPRRLGVGRPCFNTCRRRHRGDTPHPNTEVSHKMQHEKDKTSNGSSPTCGWENLFLFNFQTGSLSRPGRQQSRGRPPCFFKRSESHLFPDRFSEAESGLAANLCCYERINCMWKDTARPPGAGIN